MGDKFRSGARGNDSSYNRQTRLLAVEQRSATPSRGSIGTSSHTATVRGGFDVMIEANKSASLILRLTISIKGYRPVVTLTGMT
jgi:hypothetical protein